ncbi:unnamed protein product [Rhodiola kirilowii]
MAALKALRTMRDRRLGRLPLYEDITPSSRWADGTNGRSFVIDLPGFKKEEVNLEIDHESGNVTIKGRHGVGNNRFRRFSLTVKAPEDTEMKEIVGDLEGGLYTVLFPKMMVAAAEAVQEDKLGDGGGDETEPEQKKHLDADNKGLETVLGTESSKVMEKAAKESSKEAIADAAVIQAERELVETAEKKPEEAAINKTETIMEKTLETGIPEAEKEKTRTLESPTVLPQSSIRMEETAIQKPESATKPAETATKEPESATKPAETATKEPESATKPAETAIKELESATKPAETATKELESATKPAETAAIHEPKTETRTKPAETATKELESATKPAETAAIHEPKTETRPAETVETNSSTEIPKAVVESSPAPKTATTILAQEKGKRAIKDGAHKHEGIKKDGGFLENVMEKINEHKACIISAILAFSMGILISRKIR